MKDEAAIWLGFADENLKAARVLMNNGLLNPYLQNVQQAFEKAFKSMLVHISIPVKKTHSISKLVSILGENGVDIDLSEDECDLLDSIYLPSKYPLGSALPNFEPDEEICKRSIAVAERVRESIARQLE